MDFLETALYNTIIEGLCIGGKVEDAEAFFLIIWKRSAWEITVPWSVVTVRQTIQTRPSNYLSGCPNKDL